MDRVQRAAALAGEVIALAQSTLMAHLRFLDRALAALRPVVHESLWFAADGRPDTELEQLTEEL